MIRSTTKASRNAAPFGWFQGLARRLVAGQLASLDRGELVLTDARGSQIFGAPADLAVRLQVHDPRFYRDALLGGTVSVAESYVRGEWDCDDLTGLIRLFVRNADAANQLDGALPRLIGLGNRLYHWWNANSRHGSRRNIAAHYDLGNDFYRLWLDDTWAYSSGVFLEPDASLHSASVEKFDRICRKLQPTASDHLLEIGTGWGGFALHAARHYGCQITTTTISEQQHALACERIRQAGYADRVQVLKSDYRDLTGQYDQLVSIEMIEAVGHRYLDQYFGQCGRLLRPDGTFVLQAIVMPERAYPQYLRSVDFIQRHIFPGGCLPSLEAILGAMGRATDLRLVHVEDFAPHYAETLRRWRANFERQLDAVRDQGYSEEFIRLWRFYLCYCEAAFEERYIGVVQMQFDKPQVSRDPLRLSERAAQSTRELSGAPQPARRPLPSTGPDWSLVQSN